jgi:hypothetical protein
MDLARFADELAQIAALPAQGSSMTRCRACGTDIRSARVRSVAWVACSRAGSLDAQQLLHCGHELVTVHG